MHAYAGSDYLSSRDSLLVTPDYVRVVRPRTGPNLRQEAAEAKILAKDALQASFTRPGWAFLFLDDLIRVSVGYVPENQTLVTEIHRLPEVSPATGLRRLLQRLTRPSMDALFGAYLKAYGAQIRAHRDALCPKAAVA